MGMDPRKFDNNVMYERTKKDRGMIRQLQDHMKWFVYHF